jgi:hydroxymethylbilane synthase
MSSPCVARIATRRSPLALQQASEVADLLRSASSELAVELLTFDTAGDTRADLTLAAIGGQGVFVKEVQAAVLDHRADIAVHSAKDLPSLGSEDLCIAAVPKRRDPRDALIGSRLDDIPPGGLIATGSIRRRAQLAWLRPDLTFAELRGNIGTRLRKARRFDATVLATAALERLGMPVRPNEILAPAIMLPQAGQGALAVECRSEDGAMRRLAERIDHPGSRLCLESERAFLREVGGGCNLPVAAYARISHTDAGDLTTSPAGSGSEHRLGNPLAHSLFLECLIASADGRRVLRHKASATLPKSSPLAACIAVARALGVEVAHALVEEHGGNAILADIGPLQQ